MQSCPFCADTLLRHIQSGSIVWFCRHCWQAMPVLESNDRQLEVARLHSLYHRSPDEAIALNQV